MRDLLLLYGIGTIVIFFTGLGVWLQIEGQQISHGERRLGAQVALLAWAWPVALPIAIVVGFIWLIRKLLADALDY